MPPYATTSWTIGASPQNGLPAVIDLDALNPTTAELVPYHPPAPQLTPPRPHDTAAVRLKEYCIDGRGIITVMVVTWFTLAGVTAYLFISAVAAVVSAVIAAAPTIGAILVAIALAAFLMRGHRKEDDTLVLKGCNNGPTPGSHKVKLCNGRH